MPFGFVTSIERANYVAKLWKSAIVSMVEPPPPSQHGWNENGEIKWIEGIYPRNKSSLLLGDTDKVDENYGDEDSGRE